MRCKYKRRHFLLIAFGHSISSVHAINFVSIKSWSGAAYQGLACLASSTSRLRMCGPSCRRSPPTSFLRNLGPAAKCQLPNCLCRNAIAWRRLMRTACSGDGRVRPSTRRARECSSLHHDTGDRPLVAAPCPGQRVYGGDVAHRLEQPGHRWPVPADYSDWGFPGSYFWRWLE